MRVIRILQALSIALLMIPLIATAAGAIYIPGQEIPNDGQMHILAAESGQEQSPATSPWTTTGYLSGILPQASITMPALSFADIREQIDAISVPYVNSSGTATGSIVSQILPIEFRESIDMGSLMTNMPILTVPALF
jgi:hypothetical protein